MAYLGKYSLNFYHDQPHYFIQAFNQYLHGKLLYNDNLYILLSTLQTLIYFMLKANTEV